MHEFCLRRLAGRSIRCLAGGCYFLDAVSVKIGLPRLRWCAGSGAFDAHGIGRWNDAGFYRYAFVLGPGSGGRAEPGDAYIFYDRLVSVVGAVRGVSMYMVPLYASLAAWPLLGEVPRLYHALGFALILLGVLVTGRHTRAL